jgi:predicted transglutaminase-like cysteine proteinase
MINSGRFISKLAIVASIMTLSFGTNAFATQTDLYDARLIKAANQHFSNAADLSLAGLRHHVAINATDRLVKANEGLFAAPKPAASMATRNTDFNVFGSVVIPVGKLPLATSWTRVADRMTLCESSCTALGRRLGEISGQAAGLPTLEALQLVNRTVNSAITYRTDKALWHQADYWATPAEIIGKQAGDCEDFAIAKMALLRKAGFDQSQLQLIVLKDVRKQVFHAVLAVHANGGTYILDNMNNTVSNDTALRNYMPIMSFAMGKSFIHGFTNHRPEFASIGPSDLASAMPGEAF